jgi:hypothetical protein
MTASNDLAVRRALESAGVEFIDENGEARVCDFRSEPGKSLENELGQPSLMRQRCQNGHVRFLLLINSLSMVAFMQR